MSNKYVTLPIKGMHCRSCELLVEESLKDVGNVDRVQVNYSTGEAVVHYHGDKPSENSLRKAIVEAGYEVGMNEVRPFLNLDTDNIMQLMVGAGVLFLLYLVLKGFGLTTLDFNPDTSNAGFGLPLIVGLVAGISTCMALVGGLVLGLSTKFNEKHPQATRAQNFRPHLFFVGGRIVGYALFGGILGMLGAVFQLSATMNATLTMLVGALMLFIGLQLTNLFPRLNAMSISMPASISKLFGINNKRQREYSHKHASILGALTFFLPCGFTQAMQVFAVSRGNFVEGALIMGLFALGTAPGLLSIGGLSSVAKGSFKNFFFKTAGVAIVLLSLFNLNNGYTLLSTSLAFAGPADVSQANNNVADPNVTIEGGVQVVRMAETNGGYTPNTFTIKKDMPVKWIIDGQAPYSCASALIMPKLNIQKNLVAGENIIEFTPTVPGQLKFSCSMGMYTGVFNVLDGSNTSANAASNQADTVAIDTPPAPVVASGGTCGSGGCGCGGGGKTRPINTNTAPVAVETPGVGTDQTVQVVKTTYTDAKYLDPGVLKVKVGTKVRLEIDVKDNGSGCGSQITIPGLYENRESLTAGTVIRMEFTPTTSGTFPITCGMNMIRFGSITVE